MMFRKRLRMKPCTHKLEKVSLAPRYFHRESHLTMHLSAILRRNIEEYQGIHRVNSTCSPVKRTTRYDDAQREFRLKTEHPHVGRGKSFAQERYV